MPVKQLNLEHMPEPLQLRILDIAHRMQCPVDYVAASMVVALGSVIGARCAMKPKKEDDWKIIPNIWGGVVGKPSTLKTPSLSEVIKPIHTLERLCQKDLAELLLKYKVKCKALDAESNALKSDLTAMHKGRYKGEKTEEDISQRQLEIEKEREQKPEAKRFITNDATIEKLSEILSANPHGILVFRDELMGLLKSWEKEGHDADRAFFLEAWNGNGSYTTDRIGRGTVHTKNVCVAILGGTQPEKLASYLHHSLRNVGNDGLLQRFQLLVYPDPVKDWKLIDKSPDFDAKHTTQEVFQSLCDNDYISLGAEDYESEPRPYFTFDEDAQKLFYEWLHDLQLNKLDNPHEESLIVEHLSKYRKLMPALSLIFHLADCVCNNKTGKVSLQATQHAIEWCEYLETHARRIYNMVLDSTAPSAARLAIRLQRKDLEDGFCVRDIYRKGWTYLSDKELAEAACDELVKLGWLYESVVPLSGKRTRVTYLINPKIHQHKQEVSHAL